MDPNSDTGLPSSLAEARESVSKTQILDALRFAQRVHGRAAIRYYRSHVSVRMFIGAVALLLQEARRDPAAVNDLCRDAGIRSTRLEVRVTRLAASGWTPSGR